VGHAPHRRTPWVAALFVALTLVATYPIVKAPASYAYFDHSDAQLNMWIMAWDAHALRTDPLHLFNANIFYPRRDTLAYSETLLGYLPLFGPILWLRGSPALAFNVVLLFSFAASGFGMYLLARHLTGRDWPAVVAGIVYAFVPYRFVHIPQIQLEAMEWMPLALLSLHLFVERGRLRYAAGFGAAVVLGTLCCVYYGVFLAAASVIAFAALAITDRRAREPRTLIVLVLVGCVAAVVLAPLIGEYLRVEHKLGFERSISEISERSADAASYLSSTAPLHQAFGRSLLPQPHDFLFPGLVALVLATVGAIVPARRSIALTYAAIAVFGFAASFGPDGLWGIFVYRPLYALVPVFHGLRQVSRFGVLVMLGLSVLVAFGCAAVEPRWPRRRDLWQLAIAALVFLEVCPAPLRWDRPGGVQMTRVPDTPDVYRWLAQQPGEFSVLELPFPRESQVWRNARYVYWSTAHWHSLVNGYSGFAPPGYASLQRIVSVFPDNLSRQALQVRDVRYVIIHRASFTPIDRAIDPDALQQASWLSPIAHFPDADVFELQSAEPGRRAGHDGR
jgi:hypothetical protein